MSTERKIDWSKLTTADSQIIKEITDRAQKMGMITKRIWDILEMDLSATHVCGCELKLKKLLEAKNGDFIHDIWGIMNQIDRETGELKNCFVPRFAVQ